MQKYCEYPTRKGVMRGFFHEPDNPTYPVLLIFHGFTGSCLGTKFSYVYLSRILEKQGIGTLRMDFLGSGESDNTFKDMTFDDELSCARLLLEEMMNQKQVTDIYVLGHSMGGCIATELSKLYPDVIKKMVLWAPAYNLPEAITYLAGTSEVKDINDHGGFEVSRAFIEDMKKRDFYKDLDIYKNDLLIIHGTNDTTVPYSISKKYLPLWNHPQFLSIKDGNHNFDKVKDIQKVISETYRFFL